MSRPALVLATVWREARSGHEEGHGCSMSTGHALIGGCPINGHIALEMIASHLVDVRARFGDLRWSEALSGQLGPLLGVRAALIP